jgi:futalosine hydrolase
MSSPPQTTTSTDSKSMRVLVVSATALEIAPVVATLGPGRASGPVSGGAAAHLTGYSSRSLDVDVLVTGVGMVAAAAWCARILAERPYDLALNFGVCGSFTPALEPGAVVHVTADRLAELGAEDGDEFLTLRDLGLPGDSEFANPAPPDNPAIAALPSVRGITVNTVHGRTESILAVTRRFNPQVESMEGAAFMCACLIHQVAFAQVRAVSNIVERRNRDAWKLREAVEKLGATALGILEHT